MTRPGDELFRTRPADAIVATRPELVPATLPERSDEAIKSSTEALIRERFHRKSEAPPNTSER